MTSLSTKDLSRRALLLGAIGATAAAAAVAAGLPAVSREPAGQLVAVLVRPGSRTELPVRAA